MSIKAATYLHLLSTALLATGCPTYGTFTEERTLLQCEIDVACGSEARDCEAEAYPYEKDDCTRYRRAKAGRCINELEDQLAMVEEDPATCEGLRDPEVCNDATGKRQRNECSVIDGRPLRHEGRLVLAEVIGGSAWSGPEATIDARPEPAALQRRAAERWLEIARMEHASVAAFARVSLELMAVGAPPHLLEGCHRAALDEVGHARLALALARSLGGEAWDLGPLPVVPMQPVSLRQLAIDALLEGCLGEGSAAACAYVAAERAQGPAAGVSRTIAEEETRHAALAWSTVQWALQRDPSLAGALSQALTDALAQRRERARIAWPPAASLAAHGLLDEEETTQIELDVAQRVVAPVLAQLLAHARTAARADARTT